MLAASNILELRYRGQKFFLPASPLLTVGECVTFAMQSYGEKIDVRTDEEKLEGGREERKEKEGKKGRRRKGGREECEEGVRRGEVGEGRECILAFDLRGKRMYNEERVEEVIRYFIYFIF